MKNICNIQFYTGSKEEVLPGFSPEFPYIASRCELDKYTGRVVPWHWHKPVELFYMESGTLEYCTPKEKFIFPAGSGGLINSNVLHMTKPQGESEENIQLLHIFAPSFIAGQQGSRIEQKYVLPLTASPQVEMVALYPDNPEQAAILNNIHASFDLAEGDFGYELKLREQLSCIWLQILHISHAQLGAKKNYDKANDKIKQMMVYIHEHYAEKIAISALAAAAFTSERECFRAFRECLHVTPTEYLKSYRLQMACRMLAQDTQSVTAIGQSCGLGSSSYFGKTFREYIGCTPLQYRNKWRDSHINRQ